MLNIFTNVNTMDCIKFHFKRMNLQKNPVIETMNSNNEFIVVFILINLLFTKYFVLFIEIN